MAGMQGAIMRDFVLQSNRQPPATLRQQVLRVRTLTRV